MLTHITCPLLFLFQVWSLHFPLQTVTYSHPESMPATNMICDRIRCSGKRIVKITGGSSRVLTTYGWSWNLRIARLLMDFERWKIWDRISSVRITKWRSRSSGGKGWMNKNQGCLWVPMSWKVGIWIWSPQFGTWLLIWEVFFENSSVAFVKML